MHDPVVTKSMLDEALLSSEKRMMLVMKESMKELRNELQSDMQTLFHHGFTILSESIERLAISTANQFAIVHEELDAIQQDIRDIQIRQFR